MMDHLQATAADVGSGGESGDGGRREQANALRENFVREYQSVNEYIQEMMLEFILQNANNQVHSSNNDDDDDHDHE